MTIQNIFKKLSIPFIALIVFGLCISLTSCTPMDFNDIMSALLPNLWVFIAHIVASLTLLALTICLVWRPTKNALEKRRNYIANEIRQAEEARKEVFIKLQEAEKEKIEAHNRANIIVSDATNQAYKRKEEIEHEANFNAKKIRTDAETEAEKLKIKIKNESQKQIVNIAFSVAETLVKKKYNYADDSKTINEFIKQLDKGDKDE